jgi:hypothetical protein
MRIGNTSGFAVFGQGPEAHGWRRPMLEQFIPLYCVLVGGACVAGLAAIHMSQRLIAQSARARAPLRAPAEPLD